MFLSATEESAIEEEACKLRKQLSKLAGLSVGRKNLGDTSI